MKPSIDFLAKTKEKCIRIKVENISPMYIILPNNRTSSVSIEHLKKNSPMQNEKIATLKRKKNLFSSFFEFLNKIIKPKKMVNNPENNAGNANKLNIIINQTNNVRVN